MKLISVSMLSAMAAIIMGSSAATAAPQTYVCVLLASGGDIDPRMKNVDRIVVDPDEPRLDLQVSETMNTQLQENWAYFNDDENEFVGKSSVVIQSKNSFVTAAGFSSRHAMTFILNGREADFAQQTDKMTTGFIKWRCSKF